VAKVRERPVLGKRMLERRDVPRVAYDLEARVRGAVAEELLKRRADWPERRARVARGINPRVMSMSQRVAPRRI
jgi:hypothetical protein